MKNKCIKSTKQLAPGFCETKERDSHIRDRSLVLGGNVNELPQFGENVELHVLIKTKVTLIKPGHTFGSSEDSGAQSHPFLALKPSIIPPNQICLCLVFVETM